MYLKVGFYFRSQPARRREVRKQRPQRHTTAVAPLGCDVRSRTEAVASEAAAAAVLVKGESTGGLNRALHHAHSDSNHISRWCSVAKISSPPRRGSLKVQPFSHLGSSREPSPNAQSHQSRFILFLIFEKVFFIFLCI